MRTKRLFSLLLCLVMVLVLLPTSVFAALELDPIDEKEIKITGTPIGLKIGYYEVVGEKSGNQGNQYVLKIKGPSENYTLSLDGSPTQVDWTGKGLTFALKSGNNWNEKVGSFLITDSDGGTSVVGSNNVVRTGISYSGTIKKNRKFDVTYKITDPNIYGATVDKDSFYLSGFESNAFTINNSSPIIEMETPTSNNAPATFKITLDLTYTGTGNTISFTVGYELKSGEKRIVDCTTTIPKTEEYVEKNKDNDNDNDDELDPLTPYIIVDSYDYGGTSVTAGEDFTLKLRLRNTSTTNALVNIIMNVSPTGVFSMTSSSNTFFIERLGAGNIMEKEVTIKPGLTKVTDDEDANAINLSFKFQYVNTANDSKKLVSGESSESITLPIDFPDRFELGVPEVEEAYQGEDCYVAISLVNKGRSGVYNLTARIEGEGMANPGQSQYIGNLNAGTESTADFSVKYNEPGDFIGNIVVTYEDANMNPKEASVPFNISVMEMNWGGGDDDMFIPDDLPTDIPTDIEPEEDPTRPVMIAVGAIVCLMSAYVTVQKAKLKRSLFSDDDI